MNVARAALSLVVVIASLSGSDAQEVKERTEDPSRTWIERLQSDLRKIEGQDQADAASFAAASLAEAGEYDLAKETASRLAKHRRRDVFSWIAKTQSARDNLVQALATVAELPTKIERDCAMSVVASAQARRGDVADALRLLKRIADPEQRDFALVSIAEAQAVAGDFDAANATVKEIVDASNQRWAQSLIAEAQDRDNPLPKLRSSLLRTQINVLLSFSGNEHQREAIAAIAAAEKGDKAGLDRHLKAAEKEIEQSIPLERATNRTLLAVALVEAGRREEAKQMIRTARKEAGKEWLGASDIFGNPILVYLLLRLDLNDELDELMNSFDQSDRIGLIAYHANVSAIGQSYAELQRLDAAEKYYANSHSARARVHFSVGVLQGILNRKQE